MSTVKTNNLQIGQSVTATNNGTWYQPATPDGTIRYGIGNAGATTSDVVTLTSAGNVGIGTSSPGVKLQVDSGATGIYAVFNSTNANGGYFSGTSSGTTVWDIGTAKQALNVGGSLDFGLNVRNGFMAFGTGNTERMRLDSSGNLGLGVTPSGWSSFKAYQVNRASVASIGADTYFSHNWYWSGSADTYIASDYATRYSQQSGQHKWFTAPSGTAGNAISFTQAMTLDASGNLFVGTTANVAGSRLRVNQTTNSNAIAYFDNVGSGNCSGLVVSINGASNTSSWHFSGVTQGVNTWYLYGNGTTSYSSDERLKKNIQTARDGYLNDLLKLRVVKYQWKTDDPEAQQSELGLIAQEVEQIFPGLVQDAFHKAPDGNRYKVVKHSVMEFILIKAIQELSAELNELKQKVNA